MKSARSIRSKTLRANNEHIILDGINQLVLRKFNIQVECYCNIMQLFIHPLTLLVVA